MPSVVLQMNSRQAAERLSDPRTHTKLARTRHLGGTISCRFVDGSVALYRDSTVFRQAQPQSGEMFIVHVTGRDSSPVGAQCAQAANQYLAPNGAKKFFMEGGSINISSLRD